MKKLTIALNRGLMIYATVIAVVYALMMASAAVLAFGCFPKYSQPCIPAAVFSIALALCIPIVIVIDPHRTGFVWLSFSEKGVEYCALFRRKKMHSYSEYPYWSHGKYLHVAVIVDFIILSKRKLSTQELYQINQVKPSADLIKIRYNEKTYQKLMRTLPEKQRLLLRRAFPEAKS